LSEPHQRQDWSHLALFASLSTAAEVAVAIRDRQADRDPSAQEADGAALSYLSRAVPELRQLLMRLRLLVAGRLDALEGTSPLLRRFPELMLLLRASRLLHRIHQRLLSLYPAAGVDLIEGVRLLEYAAAQLLQGRTTAWDRAVHALIEDGLAFTDRMDTRGGIGGYVGPGMAS
jgi:hypothetical protein